MIAEKKHKKLNLKKGTKTAIKITKKKSTGFEKAWGFWKTTQLDLTNFKFDRE